MSYSAFGVLTAASLNRFLTVAAIKSADQSVTSSTTLVNDTELKLTLPAGLWLVELAARVTGAAAADIKIAYVLTGTASNTPIRWEAGPQSSTTDSSNTAMRSTVNGLTTAVIYGLDGTLGSAIAERFIIQNAASVSLQMQWAQNASSATATTVVAGSWLIGHPLVTS